jgi:hypothetical protein
MNHQPDKLFREKLENHQHPAPQDAWARIEKGISKKNNIVTWLRIAASLLLLAVAFFAMKSILKKDDVDVITYESIEPQQPTPDVQKSQENGVTPESESTRLKENLKVEKNKTHSLEVKTDHSTITSKPHEAESIEERIPDYENTPTQDDLAGIISPLSRDEEIATTENKKSYKLIIEADEVNQKYLNKGSLVHATSREGNPSGIKKLLDKAQDLKNNQDPIGDLRQMKNEILALNFQENKKLEQNK